MRRRDFLKKSAGAALGAGALGACGGASSDSQAPAVQTRRNIQWRMVSSFPRGLDTIFGGAKQLTEPTRIIARANHDTPIPSPVVIRSMARAILNAPCMTGRNGSAAGGACHAEDPSSGG